MKPIQTLFSALLWLFLFSCNKKDEMKAEIQAAQDLVQGEWILTDVSQNFLGALPRNTILGSRFTFSPCDVRNTDGQFRLCAGQSVINDTRYTMFYYNNPTTNEFELTILLEPPYSTTELNTIQVFSATYQITKSNDEIRFSLKRRGNTPNNDAVLGFKLSRK